MIVRNLRTEEEIMASWKGDVSKPVVSVCCITYNHEPYIEDALEGFLIQETDFPFEILIHDDASTDRTADIIREYEATYPSIIKSIFQKENQYSKGKKPSLFNFERANGQYIAMCEGDDYWVDPCKLQKQISFLENAPDYSGCTHASKILYLNEGREKKSIYKGKSEIDLGYYLRKNIFMTTGSLVFRKHAVENYPEWAKGLFAGDFVIKYLTLVCGKIKYSDDIMSVYRSGVRGSWSKQVLNQSKIDREYRDNVLALQKINELSDYKYVEDVVIKNKKLFSRYITRTIIASDRKLKIKLFIYNILYFNFVDYKALVKSFYVNIILYNK